MNLYKIFITCFLAYLLSCGIGYTSKFIVSDYSLIEQSRRSGAKILKVDTIQTPSGIKFEVFVDY